MDRYRYDDSDGIFRSIQMPLSLSQPSLFPGRIELRNWARCGSVNKMHRIYASRWRETCSLYRGEFCANYI